MTIMEIRLTESQYRELVKSFMAGQYIREDVARARSEEFDAVRALESYLLSLAPEFGAKDFVRKEKDEIQPGAPLEEECFNILDDYDNDRFWARLEADLGERDFMEQATPSERAAFDATGLMPERVKEFHRHYHREFKRHGTDRLRVEGGDRAERSRAYGKRQIDGLFESA
jgi:hypothetical protein